MTPQRRVVLIGSLYVLGAIVSWGAYFPYAKLILAKLSPDVFLIFRFGIGAAVLGGLCLRQRCAISVKRRDLPYVAAAAVVGIILHQLIQLAGLRHTSATNTGWILTLIPLVTGLLGWVFLRERISVRQWIGLAVAMTGVVLFVSDGAVGQLSLRGNVGDLLIMGSVLTWSVYTILVKSRLARYDALPLTAMIMTIGLVFFLLAGVQQISREVAVLTRRDWITLILIGVIPSGLAYYWWAAGLARLSAMNTSMFLFIEAIVASAAGCLLLGEMFTLRMVLFAVVVATGVYIAQRDRPGVYQGGE
ncbi:MAG TPA: DMT family transporter [Acidobacteriota bacterium]|nr:DMT family transporter [Acidobacteriota bacterium]